ncbi:MAG: hypothetical protein JW954_01250 [Dehalococcoidaceae bacterium]|nr:hypothetical protein [Dehalococcoidaceae bacterium]
MNIYRMLWKRIGGRPWTYIIRDFWQRYEGLCIIALVAAGVVLGQWYFERLLGLMGAFALGYLAGHLFWGTEYTPGQQGKD